MLKRVRFLQADVGSIDLEARQVSLAYGLHRERRVLTYDHLVIALGSESNFFDLPGVTERALTMKSVGDAFILRNHALGMLEAASATDNAVARRAMLTFVVAGGGFAGVETLGALNDFVREAIAYYPASSPGGSGGRNPANSGIQSNLRESVRRYCHAQPQIHRSFAPHTDAL
jgi:NADH dehydrogenase